MKGENYGRYIHTQKRCLEKFLGNITLDSQLNINSNNGVKNSVLTAKFNQIDTALSANTLGTEISLNSYIEGTNRFICPSDGYAMITSNGDGTFVPLLLNGINIATVYGTTLQPYSRVSLFVRAGSELSVDSGISGYASFLPLI